MTLGEDEAVTETEGLALTEAAAALPEEEEEAGVMVN